MLESIDVCVNRIMNRAKENFKKDGSVLPIVIISILGESGKIEEVIVPSENFFNEKVEEGKDILSTMLKSLAEKFEVLRIIMVNEVWMSPTEMTREVLEENMMKYKRIVDFPEELRKEGIMVNIQEQGGTCIKICQIIREKDNEIKFIDYPMETLNGVGRFTGFFSKT